MVKKTTIRVMVILLIGSIITAYAQEVNHNAVIICGDTPEGDANGPFSWNGVTGFEERRQYIYDEFWNDDFLMWELLYKTAKYELHGTAPDNDHINVLYGDGNDWQYCGWRYDPGQQHDIYQITDYGAYYNMVKSVFDQLAPVMGECDNLFCFTFDHGSIEPAPGWKVWLCLMDRKVRCDTFAQWIGQIDCNKKVFWMQQCHSGYFSEWLEGSNTVIITSTNDGYSKSADNISRNGSPLPENEYVVPNTFHHGEFDFHTMNAARGKAIFGTSYYNPPVVDADENNDLLISMDEVYDYEYDHYSTFEFPQYSDPSAIGTATFLGWDDYTAPAAPTGLHVENATLNGGVEILLEWNANTEQDLVGYYVYRRTRFTPWEWRGASRSRFFEDYCNYNIVYWYYVKALDVAKNVSNQSNVIVVYFGGGGGGGQSIGSSEISTFTLDEPFPNPMRHRTTISYDLPEQIDISLDLYDIAGKKIRTLIKGKIEAGHHTLMLDKADLSSGLYVVHLKTSGFQASKKLTIVN